MNWYSLVKDRLQGKAPLGAKRSPKWRLTRKAHLQLNPVCFVCGKKTKVEVHHIMPFHLAPDMELEPSNLLTLCENKSYGINCHLLIGHLGDFRNVNPEVEIDAMIWKMKLRRENV